MKFFKKITDLFSNLFNFKDDESKIDQKIEAIESIKTQVSNEPEQVEAPVIEAPIEATPVVVETNIEVKEVSKVETVKDIKSQTKKNTDEEKPKSRKPKRKPKKKQEDK